MSGHPDGHHRRQRARSATRRSSARDSVTSPTCLGRRPRASRWAAAFAKVCCAVTDAFRRPGAHRVSNVRGCLDAAFGAIAIAAWVGAFALLMSGCAYIFIRPPPGFCRGNPGSPIRDFCIVTPGTLWEGERPSTAGARWLLAQGVGSIVSIQVDDRATFRATKVPPELVLSIPYFRIRRFNAVRLLSRTSLDERVALFLAIIRQAPKPVYLHCHLGVDRALVLAAAYRILIEGLDPERAIKDVQGLHSPWLLAETRYLRSLTPARKSDILHMADYWLPRVRVSAEIRCAKGRCRYARATADWLTLK